MENYPITVKPKEVRKAKQEYNKTYYYEDKDPQRIKTA